MKPNLFRTFSSSIGHCPDIFILSVIQHTYRYVLSKSSHIYKVYIILYKRWSLVLWCFVDRCLSFCTFSFGHCVVCSSLIYGVCLHLWYLQILFTLHFCFRIVMRPTMPIVAVCCLEIYLRMFSYQTLWTREVLSHV